VNDSLYDMKERGKSSTKGIGLGVGVGVVDVVVVGVVEKLKQSEREGKKGVLFIIEIVTSLAKWKTRLFVTIIIFFHPIDDWDNYHSQSPSFCRPL
jgi:hypothetical protein